MKNYALILGAGVLLLLNSCDKAVLEPTQINMERVFLEANSDTTKKIRDWDKQFNDDEEPPEEPGEGSPGE